MLFIIRHAQAFSSSQDPEEKLTLLGEAQAAAISKFLLNLGAAVSEIWFSPKNRARQTAEIIAATALPSAKMVEKRELIPDGNLIKVSGAINRAEGNIVIVSHLPFVSELASYLLTGDEHSAASDFTNCALMCLEPGASWKLKWFIKPDIIEK